MWLTGRAIGVATIAGAVSPDYRVFRPRCHDPRFLHHLLRSDPYIDQYKLYTRAETTFDRRVQQDDLDNTILPVPPLNDQRRIGDFLDRETAQINALIGKQEQLIATLREDRAATITQAVTKGLDPEVGMKESGLPWVGDVPAHWRIAPARSLLELRRELVGSRSADFLLLSLTLRGVVVRDLSDNKGKFPTEFDTYQAVEPGDLVFCLFDVEETPRTVGLAHDRGMVTGAYDVFRVREPLEGRYMEYLYLSVDQKKALSYYYSGLRNVIRMPTFKSIRWPVPPLSEQRFIADFLDKRTSKIDALAVKSEQLIARLQEYRATLIVDAVTGKINLQESA